MGILRERERISPGPACHSWKWLMTLGLSPNWSVNWKTKHWRYWSLLISSVLSSRLNTSWPLWRTRRSGSPGWASRWPLCHGRAGRCCRSATAPPSSGPGSRLQSQCRKGSHRGCPLSASGQNGPAASTSAKEATERCTALETNFQNQMTVCLGTLELHSGLSAGRNVLAWQLLPDSYFSGL